MTFYHFESYNSFSCYFAFLIREKEDKLYLNYIPDENKSQRKNRM